MPLLVDNLWVGMAVTIIAGLTFGSILTMVMVPVLYATVCGVHMDSRQVPAAFDSSTVLEPALR